MMCLVLPSQSTTKNQKSNHNMSDKNQIGGIIKKVSIPPVPIEKLSVYAWVGEDELGNGEIGIKQAMVPAGMIPLASLSLDKLSQDYIRKAMDAQGKLYKKTIRLCKFKFEEITIEVGDTSEPCSE